MTAADHLYALLPEVFRTRDGEAAVEAAARLGLLRPDKGFDGPLHSLLTILGAELELLEAEAGRLYDDLFIDTCADWVVPYIGDLIGARLVDAGNPSSARRQVGDTIVNRRGKGTARTLARRAGDLSGHPAEAIEYFQHVVTALHLDYPGDNRAQSVAINGPAGRSLGSPARIGQHVAEVRDMVLGGRYAVPNIGIRVWPMRALEHAEAVPTRVAGGDPGRFRFSPLGADLALWRAHIEDDPEVTRLTPDAIPGPIPLRDAVDRPAAYYGTTRSLALFIDDVVADLAAVCFCDLSDRAADGSTWNARGSAAEQACIRIDPARGRIALPPTMFGLTPDSLRIRYHYGASATVGGGGYARERLDLPGGAVIDQSATRADAETAFADALVALAATPDVAVAYGGTLSSPALVDLPARRTLRIAASGTGVWPTLIAGPTWRLTGGRDSTLVLEGLRLAGGTLAIDTDGLHELVLRDCTLVPGISLDGRGDPLSPAQASLSILQPGLVVRLERCVCGSIRVDPSIRLIVTDSLIDSPSPDVAAISAPAGAGGILAAGRSTFLGDVAVAAFDEVSDSLFASRSGRTLVTPSVSAVRLQEGCVRYSALPPGALVPRRYRCFPPEGASEPGGPLFASPRYGTASHGRLLMATPAGILSGAENRREMGVMNRQSWALRRTALARDLPDWTPFAIVAGEELIFD